MLDKKNPLENLSKEKIIPGYDSLFDHIASASGQDRENLKQRYAEADRMLWESTTIPDLYSVVQKVINLPPAEDEKNMRLNLLNLALALDNIPLNDRREGVELAIDFIDYRVMPRFNTLTGGPQPKI